MIEFLIFIQYVPPDKEAVITPVPITAKNREVAEMMAAHYAKVTGGEFMGIAPILQAPH